MRRGMVISCVVFAAFALAWLSTGWIVVAPGEVVVVRRLGRVVPTPWMPGPHLGWPQGLDRRVRVRTDLVRRLEVGLTTVPGTDDEPGAGEYLTGDLNLIRARIVVQYRVAHPATYVLRAEDLEPKLARISESSLARALSRRGIDAALRLERAAIAREVEADLSRSVREADLGIAILGVNLTDARAPGEVAPDFAAAQDARSARERRANEAKSYAATTLAAARSEAAARIDRARARAHRSVVVARGRAGRFLAMLAEADRSRPLTVRRLYFDALRELWPRVKRKVVLDPNEAVDLSLLGVETP